MVNPMLVEGQIRRAKAVRRRKTAGVLAACTRSGQGQRRHWGLLPRSEAEWDNNP
jgi:hypothetical protein